MPPENFSPHLNEGIIIFDNYPYHFPVMRFEDHFSGHAGDYAQHRPHYPSELFAYLASIAPDRRLAWDCGTGNGQAALELAKYFELVHATDASPQQIAQAFEHERIKYAVESAESVSLPSGAADLVTVAVAVHWFDFDKFYAEVKRVLKPGGVLAVWTYHLPEIEPAIDAVLQHYYGQVLAAYWPERIQYLHERYRTLPFPFAEIAPPEFIAGADWDLQRLSGFLDSWSASRKYLQVNHRHPLREVAGALMSAWGEPELNRRIRWPLHLRIGKANLSEAGKIKTQLDG
ncbi:MAG TPA: class I SAM-dependent methyltransferase [bacterium]|jgi:SAM-dependent methyltransferase